MSKNKAQYNIKSIVVDTVNAIQNVQHAEILEKKGKAQHDDWTDYGVDLYLFIERLKDLGFELVLILGKEGSGKSFGIKGLTPGEYIWFNADKKNPTFARPEHHLELYGTKVNPGPLMRIPTKYSQIIDDVKAMKKGIETPNFDIKLSNNPIAFLIGHTEEYRNSEGGTNQRLRVLGRMATKMHVEGSSEYTLVAGVNIVNNRPVGYLRTASDGNDTCRTPEGAFDNIRIPNDFSLIVSAINKANNITL